MQGAGQQRTAQVLPGEWPYWAGGIALAILNALILLASDRPWGVTTTLTHIGSRTLQAIGFEPANWTYFTEVGRDIALTQFGWWDSSLWLNLGVVAGSLLASLAAGEFFLRPLHRTGRQLVLSLAGGILMGYGARLALGCSVGGLIGGVSSFSLHGWVFLLAVISGVLAGIKLFQRFL